MSRRLQRRVAAVGFVLLGMWSAAARGQGPTVDSGPSSTPGGIRSSLGALPGSGVNSLGSTPGGGGNVLSGDSGSGAPISGRAGATGPHVSTATSTPSAQPGPNDQPSMGIAAPAPRATYSAPSYGSYSLPSAPEDDGPAEGLTMDMAIERLIRENLDLRAKSFEIPQARADILNAGLRNNPVFYADTQLVPYGRYTRDRPGGQTQYDVNISYPLDVSGKRQARKIYATRAERVIEAQYQDAVRNSIDQLYSAYVDVLAARQTVRYSASSIQGLTALLKVTEQLYEKDQNTRADVNRVQVQFNTAEVGYIDAQEGLKKSKRNLATLLNLPNAQASTLELRGTIEDVGTQPPAAEELLRMALSVRPDAVAYRLGVKTAESNVKLQLANRFTDVYVLYQPYTFQDNSPFGLKSPTSWAIGATVPLPIYNRNQGGILRAKLNVTQSQVELSTIERQIVNEVEQALNEYGVTSQMVLRIKEKLLPAARQVRNDTERLYLGGEVNVVIYLNAQRDYQDTVKQYLDTVIRHRRAMLALNTVLGQRILP